MELFSHLKNSYQSLLGKENRKSPEDVVFERAVLEDPSKTHVDITSNDVHRSAVNYNKGMTTQAMLRSEVSYYLQWGALGLFGAALTAGALGKLKTLVGTLWSAEGFLVAAGAVALAATAIYIKMNNAKIQSEKNMNLGEFEMRRGAKIMAQEIAKELKPHMADPSPSLSAPPASDRRWVDHIQTQASSAEITSQHLR